LLGILFHIDKGILPNNHISHFNYVTEEIGIRGIVVEEGYIDRKDRQTFVMEVRKVIYKEKTYDVTGKAQVRASGDVAVSYGDEVLIRGGIDWPYNFSTNRGFNYRRYLKVRGIYSIITVKKNNPVLIVSKGNGNPIKSSALSIRNKLRDVLQKKLSPVSASIYAAILLGERRDVPKVINELFLRLGAIHILAISGLHTGIVAFIFLLLFKACRIPKKARFAITMILLVFYCLLTGLRISVVRATIMAEILLLGYILEREVNIYNSLSLAALIILFINPDQLFDAGFQLSFVSVLSIVWIAPRIRLLFSEKWLKRRVFRFLILAFCVSTAAWFGTSGLTAYYFRVFSPIAILANIIIVPYLGIFVACGFLLLASVFFFSPVSTVVAVTCELLVIILLKFSAYLVKIPSAYFQLSALPLRIILFYYAVVFLVFRFAKER